MSGNNFLLDSNIVLYLLSGDQTLANLLRFSKLYVSFITELELLSFHGIDELQKEEIKKFLKQCIVIDINESIKENVINLRKTYKVKLPDCIVAATSVYINIPLITSDKGLFKIKEANIVQYHI